MGLAGANLDLVGTTGLEENGRYELEEGRKGGGIESGREIGRKEMDVRGPEVKGKSRSGHGFWEPGEMDLHRALSLTEVIKRESAACRPAF